MKPTASQIQVEDVSTTLEISTLTVELPHPMTEEEARAWVAEVNADSYHSFELGPEYRDNWKRATTYLRTGPKPVALINTKEN